MSWRSLAPEQLGPAHPHQGRRELPTSSGAALPTARPAGSCWHLGHALNIDAARVSPRTSTSTRCRGVGRGRRPSPPTSPKAAVAAPPGRSFRKVLSRGGTAQPGARCTSRQSPTKTFRARTAEDMSEKANKGRWGSTSWPAPLRAVNRAVDAYIATHHIMEVAQISTTLTPGPKSFRRLAARCRQREPGVYLQALDHAIAENAALVRGIFSRARSHRPSARFAPEPKRPRG